MGQISINRQYSILQWSSVLVLFVIYAMIKYQMLQSNIYSISIGIPIHENLGLDTQITCLLQLKRRLWNILETFTEIQCEIGSHLGYFNGLCPFTNIIKVWHAGLCIYLIPWPRKYRFGPPNNDPTWSNFRDIGNLRYLAAGGGCVCVWGGGGGGALHGDPC